MKKTILLLALSTFSRNKVNTQTTIFDYIEEKENGQRERIEVNGNYQLEPVPNLLKRMGKPIDYVVMLCTEETRKVRLVETEDDFVQMSEESYFTEWIKTNFVNSERKEVECEPVTISEIDPGIGIRDAITYIDRISKQNETELIIDTHGGFRSSGLIMQAIAHLWQKNVFDMTVYDVMYQTIIPDSGEQKRNLIQKSKASDIFDFVSGITEFTNYGRIDSLQRIFEGETDRELLNPIMEIADGIQWADITNFEMGLKHLKNYFKKNKKPNDIYLSIFQERIQKDYGELLNEDKIDDAIVIARWCLKKGFYQQVLTLIEGKIADTLKKRSIFAVTGSGERFASENRIYYSQKRMSDTDVFNGVVFAFEGRTNWWQEQNNNPDDLNRNRFNQMFGNMESGTRTIKSKLLELIQRKNGGRSSEEMIVDTLKSVSYRTLYGDKVCNDPVMFHEQYSADQKDNVVMLLFLHKTLKEMRNNSNHMLGRTLYKANAIRRCIEFYLDLIDELTLQGYDRGKLTKRIAYDNCV